MRPHRRSEPTRILQWAQEHGEVGGVHASHRQLTAALRDEGYDVRYVDTGSARRAASSVPSWWRRHSVHLFHITRLWRAIILAPVFVVLPGRTVLVLHSGSTLGQVRQLSSGATRVLNLALRAYDEIWAVNGEIRGVLPPLLHARVKVVSPFVPSPLDHSGPRPRRDPHAISVATNAGLEHYHAELAVEAVRLIRAGGWPDATLRVLAYGHDGAHLARLRVIVDGLDWVTLSFDAPGDDVRTVLAACGVFLRPTAWDGDSVIVREALAAGARVVAADTAPRPMGVELSALDPQDFADAVLRGGRPSSGDALATENMLAAAMRTLSMMGR